MGTRLQLQTILENIIGKGNVYFQPPSNVSMTYPCIVYSLDSARTSFADNLPFIFKKRYQITLIDKNPDSSYINTIGTSLPSCVFNRHFTADYLHHFVYTIFF